jgi:membrane protein
VVLLCAEFNAVRAGRMWPRSLLMPFADNVRLTPGDKRAYISYATTKRHKNFEHIDVSFAEAPPPGPAEPGP